MNLTEKIVFQISYETIGVVQMNFLRLLSQEAYQNFTYTCTNSVAWYDGENRDYNLSLRLLGDNEDEFSYNGIRPRLIVDKCDSRSGKEETVFLIRTSKLRQLPLIDFYPVDYGSPQQAFGFKVGPVCFK